MLIASHHVEPTHNKKFGDFACGGLTPHVTQQVGRHFRRSFFKFPVASCGEFFVRARKSRVLAIFMALLAGTINGCATADAPKAVPTAAALTAKPGGTAAPAVARQNDADLARLRQLWLKRSEGSGSADYPIGAGDILEVSVPAMEELRAQSVRVAGDGTITLPFIGTLTANGHTEEALRTAIETRLKKYMHAPRVSIFVKEHRNRQVAVLGSVNRPGVYSLRSENDTILDMVSQAGGIASGADPRIHLVPAEPADKAAREQFAGTLPAAAADAHTTMLLKKTEPIIIDVEALAYGGFQEYLTLRVRPGDVIMVPGGGQILVDGWIAKPGAYNVTPGMTVSGIVAAAGGLLYPADAQLVKLIRSEKDGKKSLIYSDLEKIKNGDEQDIALRGGDFIEISAAPGKLVPYAFYRFFTTVVNVAVGGQVPLFR